ncbi:MAG TPA: beta/gamma crystallin-related protein [Albitalea sp.]|nr:beta/gamma crystallin-related protein [Albitalea sp.]
MNSTLKFAFGATALALAAQASAQVTFYEGEGFRGRTFASARQVENFQSYGFNDRASSVIVDRGQWEVCEDARFQGRCTVLRRGNYESLSAMGMNDRISSMRPVGNRARYDNEAPQPVAATPYEYRRRPNERTFEAPVTSVRAVVGPPEQRCWVEHQQVPETARGGANVGGGIAGALIGGILGHQVGGGTGKDLATIGGAVAGGAIGANVGRNNTTMVDREVRRCDTVASTQPAYWDVTYNYRGVEHRLQMSSAPGTTIAVNRDGEPRG